LVYKLQALIFDVDGTLADTERDGHRIAFNQAFAAAGLDWNWSEAFYGELLEVTGGKERMRHYVTQYQPDFAPPADLTEFIDELHAAKTQHYQRLVADGKVPLRPGVKRLIEEARDQGVRLAIATTSALPNVTALLETKLAPDSPTWFEVIGAGDMVPEKKPASDVYHYVLEEMHLSAQDCLAIEDSYHGFIAADQVGIKTIVTVNDYTRDQDFPGALLVLDHLGEPDQPFTVLAGNAGEATYVDIALLRRLYS
jgi:beta-phosphoglucomutase-like phosphatase (HAD superfamily)